MRSMQVTITLDGRESEVLRREAMRELRRPKDQARFMLRQALGIAELPVPQTQNGTSQVGQDKVASAVP